MSGTSCYNCIRTALLVSCSCSLSPNCGLCVGLGLTLMQSAPSISLFPSKQVSPHSAALSLWWYVLGSRYTYQFALWLFRMRMRCCMISSVVIQNPMHSCLARVYRYDRCGRVNKDAFVDTVFRCLHVLWVCLAWSAALQDALVKYSMLGKLKVLCGINFHRHITESLYVRFLFKWGVKLYSLTHFCLTVVVTCH